MGEPDPSAKIANELGLDPGAGGSTDVVLARLEGGIARLAERLESRHDALATAVEAVRREGSTANKLLETVLVNRMDADRAELRHLQSEVDELKGKVESDRAASREREQREREIVAEKANVRLSGLWGPLLVGTVVALIGLLSALVIHFH